MSFCPSSAGSRKAGLLRLVHRGFKHVHARQGVDRNGMRETPEEMARLGAFVMHGVEMLQ